MRDIKIHRPTLGPFMHVICFRYLGDDAEDLAGRALVVDAGRQRGHDVMEELGVMGSHQDPEAIKKELNDVIGLEGTRLCIIESVEKHADGGFEVHVREPACITYTLGVLVGAISAMTGVNMLGKDAPDGDKGEEGRVYHIYPL